jgi:hypothetical protein
MQVGSRFSQGETPRGVSDDFVSHLRQVEAELTPEESTLRWTLTWLERRPVATLDNGTVVRG